MNVSSQCRTHTHITPLSQHWKLPLSQQSDICCLTGWIAKVWRGGGRLAAGLADALRRACAAVWHAGPHEGGGLHFLSPRGWGLSSSGRVLWHHRSLSSFLKSDHDGGSRWHIGGNFWSTKYFSFKFDPIFSPARGFFLIINVSSFFAAQILKTSQIF